MEMRSDVGKTQKQLRDKHLDVLSSTKMAELEKANQELGKQNEDLRKEIEKLRNIPEQTSATRIHEVQITPELGSFREWTQNSPERTSATKLHEVQITPERSIFSFPSLLSNKPQDTFEMASINNSKNDLSSTLENFMQLEFQETTENFPKYLESLYNRHLENAKNLQKNDLFPGDILMKDGEIVTSQEQTLKDKEIQNRLKDLEQTGLSKLYKTLERFRGESINYVVNHAKNQDLNVLADITVYNLALSQKKAFTIPDHKLSDLWHRVRDIYERQNKYRENDKNNKKAALDLMSYAEKYSLLRSTAPDNTRRSVKRLCNTLWYLLASTRYIKEKASIAVNYAEARLNHIEDKHGKKHVRSLDNGQEPNLQGKRGKEQRKLRLIRDSLKKRQREGEDIKIKGEKEILALKNFLSDIHLEINKLAEKPQYKTDEGQKKISGLYTALHHYLAIMYFTNLHKTNLAVEMSSREIQGKLEELKVSLQRDIRRYGNSPLLAFMNDLSSDGGALWSVVTTSGSIAGTLAAGGAMF